MDHVEAIVEDVSLDGNVEGSEFKDWTVVERKRSRLGSDRRPRLDLSGPPRTPHTVARSVSSGVRANPSDPRASVGRPGVRLPKAAAVSSKASKDGVSYADIMKKAKSSFALTEIGIDSARIREVANGGILIEVPGPDGASKADTLVDRLKMVLGESASVTRPIKMGEVRMIGFDISVSSKELREAFASAGKCGLAKVRVGPVRRMVNGLRSAWVQCPASVAGALAASGQITVGWATVRIDSFRVKPTQCFRCWHFGHVRSAYRASIDRSGHCFRCGKAGHTLKECDSLDVRCVVCEDNKMSSSHRLGSAQCNSFLLRAKRNIVTNG